MPTRRVPFVFLLLLLFSAVVVTSINFSIWKQKHKDIPAVVAQDYKLQHPYAVAIFLAIVAFVIFFTKPLSEEVLGTPILRRTRQGSALPFIGHALTFVQFRPWDLLMQWHETYGAIICFELLGTTMFSIASPNLIKQVLQSKIKTVKKDIANTMKPFLVILGTGIVTSENESWMQQRLKMSHPLRRDVLELIPKQTLLAVQRWMQVLDQAAASGETVAVGSSLRHLTLQVISGSFLSLSSRESDTTFAQLYLPIVDEANKRVWHPYRGYLPILPAWWRQLYNVYCLNVYVSKLIQDRWQLRRTEDDLIVEKERDMDVLDRVLEVYEREKGTKDCLPESAVRQLRDEMKTFMLAGHETSAAMMTWAIYEILSNDKLQERIAKEAYGVFGDTDWLSASPSELPHQDEISKLVVSEAALRVSSLCMVDTSPLITIYC
jgi:cytochrome P450